MSIHFQPLHADVFEDRALPSVSFLTIPAGYFSSAAIRIADQGLLSTPKPFSQATAMRFNEQGFGLVPLWMNNNGSATYLIVNLRNAPPTPESVSFGPVSQRLSAGATREAATDTIQQTAQQAQEPSAQPNDMPVSYHPEQATTETPQPSTPRTLVAARVTQQQETLPTTPTAPHQSPVLRDYSTSAVNTARHEPLVVERGEGVPTPETSTPTTPPTSTPVTPEPSTLTVEDLNATPLAGLLPFNVADLETEATNLLQRIANFGDDIAEEISSSSEYVWLTAAAVIAGGAAFAARSTKTLKPVSLVSGPLAAWEDKHDDQSR